MVKIRTFTLHEKSVQMLEHMRPRYHYGKTTTVHEHFWTILAKHPDFARKVGTKPVTHFYTDMLYGSPTVHFVTEDRDDTFAYAKLARGQPVQSAASCLKEAMRQAIEPQIMAYRSSVAHICAECGSTDRPQVDHMSVPFSAIAGEFLAANPQPPTGYDKEGPFRVFREEDSEFAEDWRTTHAARADYQILCQPCNGRKSNN
jgi:hypothetical protein